MPNHLRHGRPPRAPRTWRFYAGITFGVVMLLVIGLLGAFWMLRQSLIRNYTAATPMSLPTTDIRSEDRQALRDKWGRFLDDLQAQRQTAPLTMSSKELNVFFSMIPQLRDRAYGSIEDDRLRIEFSAPLDDVGMKGRYANGVSLVTLKLDKNGLAKLELVSTKLNGKEMPEWFKKQVNQHPEKNPDLNIVQRILTDAKLGQHLKSIEFRDGLLVFHPVPATQRPF